MNLENNYIETPYANYTIRLLDWLECNPENPTLLKNCFKNEDLLFSFTNKEGDTLDESKTNYFYELFVATWSEFEINGETQALFLRYVKNDFKKYIRYYNEKINNYSNKPEYDIDTPIATTKNKGYELPHKEVNEVVKGYLTNEDDIESYSKMQDIEYYRSMNNIVKDFYVDFVHKFKDCFIMLLR